MYVCVYIYIFTSYSISTQRGILDEKRIHLRSLIIALLNFLLVIFHG